MFVKEKTTLFEHLSPEVLLQILDELDFPDLLAMAQVDPRLAVWASDSFRRRFDTISFDASACYSRLSPVVGMIWVVQRSISPKLHRIMSYDSNQGEIRIFEREFALQTMQSFGGSVRKVQLSYGTELSRLTEYVFHWAIQMDVISAMVNKYCHDTLLEMEILTSKKDSLKRMTKPFERVEYVAFYNSLPESISGSLQMNQLFPAMERLSLENLREANVTSYIDCHLPHLMHLHIDLLEQSTNDTIFNNLVKKNPQIQSIELCKTSATLLSTVHSVLLNLESLTLCSAKHDAGELHFDSVKKLAITSGEQVASIDMQFVNLNELHGYIDGRHLDHWLQFLKKHQRVHNFAMKYAHMTDAQFEMIAALLPNLNEMHIYAVGPTFLSTETVVRLIERSTNLTRFTSDRHPSSKFQEKLRAN